MYKDVELEQKTQSEVEGLPSCLLSSPPVSSPLVSSRCIDLFLIVFNCFVLFYFVGLRSSSVFLLPFSYFLYLS